MTDKPNPTDRIKDLLQLDKPKELEVEPGHHPYCIYPSHACECQAHYQLDAESREIEEMFKAREEKRRKKLEDRAKLINKVKSWFRFLNPLSKKKTK